MMLKPRWTRIVLLALSGMTASCAVSLPPSAEPPRLTLPAAAATPCVLERLPEAPTQADLEVAYVERGARLVACENARASAVETLKAERALQDRWRRETDARRRPAIWPWSADVLRRFGQRRTLPNPPGISRPARPAHHSAEGAGSWQVLPE